MSQQCWHRGWFIIKITSRPFRRSKNALLYVCCVLVKWHHTCQEIQNLLTNILNFLGLTAGHKTSLTSLYVRRKVQVSTSHLQVVSCTVDADWLPHSLWCHKILLGNKQILWGNEAKHIFESCKCMHSFVGLKCQSCWKDLLDLLGRRWREVDHNVDILPTSFHLANARHTTSQGGCMLSGVIIPLFMICWFWTFYSLHSHIWLYIWFLQIIVMRFSSSCWILSPPFSPLNLFCGPYIYLLQMSVKVLSVGHVSRAHETQI